jgi:Tol biopolymer transport system component
METSSCWTWIRPPSPGLTQTPAEEKDPEFSPDGRFVSFVRANNIYVWDLPLKKETTAHARWFADNA